ncbi:MAG TPA: FixH family protein [Ktedonobacterales bacterium]
MPSRLEDLAARGVILAGGVLVLVLMLWGHFGLGAFFVPPARTQVHQVAVAGPYRVALALPSGQLTARGPNTVAFVLEDRAGHVIPGASLRVEPWMTTMPMSARPVVATSRADGQVVVHPILGMAGTWHLILTITSLGQPPTHVSFDVGVRWS